MEKKHFLVISFLIVTLCACGESPERRAIKVGEDGVLNALKDPDSAKFKDVYVMPQIGKDAGTEDSDYTVCGHVNSKNSFGGYTGYTRFVIHVIGGKAMEPVLEEAELSNDVDGTDETNFETMYWKNECIVWK